MGSDWKTIPLGELYDFSSGLSKPRSEFGFGHGFLSFKDVFYNYFAPDKLEQLVNSTEKEQQSCSIRRGDVFLTRTSETMDELGMSCVALRDYDRATFNGFTKRLRPKDPMQVVPEYAGYYFRSPSFRREVTAMSSLSTRASLNNEMLARLKIVLPPRETQQTIGSILKALDDKLKLNRRMNATLEAMARALFQSWFVDFDPVRTKLDGRQPPGLDSATMTLFPDTFRDSELGPIPHGWEIVRLDEIASVMMGLSPAGDSYNANGVGTPLINGPVEFGEYFPAKTKWTEAATRLAEAGDLIFCVRGSTTGRRVVSDGEYAIGRGVCSIRPKGEFHSFLYQTINIGLDRLLEKTTGSVFPSLSAPDIKGFSVLKPSNGVLEAYEAMAKTWVERIQQNHHQSRTLACLRDSLLPKLLNGKIS